jgi:hypothetical protein
VKALELHFIGRARLFALAVCSTLTSVSACASTIVFFSSSQATNLVSTNATSDTLSSEGYLFTFSRDKLFTGGVGMTNPIGRAVRIEWPQGLEAQAITAGPTTGSARFDIRRHEGQPFAIQFFTARLLANTAGAGADIEVMPLLNGEDGFPEPLKCPATGYYGQEFTYDTPTLAGFDSYKITLYVDFALTSLTIVDSSIPPPVLSISPVPPGLVQVSWPAEAVGYTLESTPNPASDVWSQVTDQAINDGISFTVQLEAAGLQRFYRLRK